MSKIPHEETLLGGLEVLDLTDGKGMYCTKLLAELGANVVKIEKPGGDSSRNIGPFYRDIPHPEKSLHWWYYNTSKKSITLNLETSEGKEIFKRLVKRADILVETPTPGLAVGAGLGYEALSQLNPKLIVTSITNFGTGGVYGDYRASDIVGVAMGGLMGACGDPDLPPVMPYGEIAFYMVSNYAAVATLIALYQRDMTGRGQLIDVPMQTCVAFTLEYLFPFYVYKQINLKRMGSRPLTLGPGSSGSIYPCKDGYVYCGMLAPPLDWLEAEEAVEDLKEDQRLWDDWVYRTEKEVHIFDVFSRFVRTRTKEEIWEKTRRFRGAWSPVYNIEDVCADPHLAERGFFVEVEHPELGERFPYPGLPMKIQDSHAIIRRAPLIGEHNEEIYLKELGLSREELVSLASVGVI